VPSAREAAREEQPLPEEWCGGLDGGARQQQVSGLDRDRRRGGARGVDHAGASLARRAAWRWPLAAGPPQRGAVAIAVPRGAMVAGLRARGCPLVALHPTPRARCRARHRAAGAKADRRDAVVLAEAVRPAQPRCRRVPRGDPPLVRLRERSRAAAPWLAACRRQATRGRDQGQRFSPPLLPRCAAAAAPWLWARLDRAPPPAHTALWTEEQGQRVRQAHRRRRVTAQAVLPGFQALALAVAPGAAAAAQAHGPCWLPCRRVLAEPLQAWSPQGSALLRPLAEAPGQGEGPAEVALVLALPGGGRTRTAWRWAEAAQPWAGRDDQRGRTHGGGAPGPKHSGQGGVVVRRRGCNPRWRHALDHRARGTATRPATACLRRCGRRASARARPGAMLATDCGGC
jgi:Transposase